MIIDSLFSTIISATWFLIPVAFITFILRSRWFKGKVGEFVVNFAARIFLNKNDYHLLKNVTLPSEDGSTQIDHIIVSRFGVFVIETKNMKGWIFGSEKQKQWTQKIYKHTSKFQNPLHQNYKHVQTLKTLIGLSDEHIFSVIVFVGDSTFKTDMPENVTQAGGYIRYVKSKQNRLLDDVEVERILEDIQSGKLTASFKTDRQHVEHVRKLVKNKRDESRCPRCGADMKIRTAKSGRNAGRRFWGCSDYPECRGTRPVS